MTPRRSLSRLPKPAAEDLDQRELAVRRLGATTAERLAWVVAFTRRDIAVARPEELIALGYDLRALTPPLGTLTRSEHRPLSAPTIRKIQTRLTAGLRQLLTPNPAHEGGWTLPPPRRVRLVRIGEFVTRIEESRDEVASILAAVGELAVRAGVDLRGCPECGRAFVRTGRRKFCSEKCSMRVRNRKRPSKAKGAKNRPVRRPGSAGA